VFEAGWAEAALRKRQKRACCMSFCVLHARPRLHAAFLLSYWPAAKAAFARGQQYMQRC